MAKQKLSDSEYYARAVTWAVIGVASLVGVVALFHLGTGTIR